MWNVYLQLPTDKAFLRKGLQTFNQDIVLKLSVTSLNTEFLMSKI